MKKSDASITFICGMRGCGKSTLTRLLSQSHDRLIVFDYVNEWNGPDFRYAKNYNEFANIFREVFHQTNYTIVIKFGFGTPQQQIEETSAQIITLLYTTGYESELETCLVFEEAQFYFPNYQLKPEFMSLLTIGRHGFINILANTQRPASVSKLLISQAARVYVGKLFEMNDIKYLAESVGSQIAMQAPTLQDLQFVHYRSGYPDETVVVEL